MRVDQNCIRNSFAPQKSAFHLVTSISVYHSRWQRLVLRTSLLTVHYKICATSRELNFSKIFESCLKSILTEPQSIIFEMDELSKNARVPVIAPWPVMEALRCEAANDFSFDKVELQTLQFFDNKSENTFFSCIKKSTKCCTEMWIHFSQRQTPKTEQTERRIKFIFPPKTIH